MFHAIANIAAPLHPKSMMLSVELTLASVTPVVSNLMRPGNNQPEKDTMVRPDLV